MMNFRFPQFTQIPIETVVPNLSKDALHLLKDMLQWNPAKRPTAVQSLKYAYFANVDLTVPLSALGEKTVTNVKTAPNLSEYSSKKSAAASLYNSNASKTMPNYVQPSSPNVDNHSIQQLQMQIGSHVPGLKGASNNKVNNAQHNNSNHNKSAVSMKDQYLSRSRYIAGQKSGLYKNSGKNYTNVFS